ncbi:MAG: hypothetical protein HUJ26_12505 [Planctomycetaceae bacterium]|nr:hypothetical protein [Planctomycetaceae bacterium]
MSLPLAIRRLPEVVSQTDARTLCGTFAGVVSSVQMHRTSIDRLIPVGSGLVPVAEPEDERHTVLFLFGQQRQVRNVWGKWEFQYGFGREYEEVLLVIPGLRTPPGVDHPALSPVTLYARIFLNSLCSSILGRLMYGFSKHIGRFENEEASFTAYNRHSERIFSATFSPTTGNVSESEVARIRELFSCPVVFAGKPKKDAQSPLSIRKFDYDIRADSIEPVETAVTVEHQFTKKSPLLSFSNVGLDRDSNGAFRCEFPWVMTTYRPAA